ncbi:unnamed protein product [Echinostoma caproni]|uniref:CUGBP Elav-like family member 3 n=1 Tax=Echinostoma caproni TaxID=27848 RepID=A0A183A1E9_9TREM|nr:unnamed protein product [Echinostoma caproni]
MKARNVRNVMDLFEPAMIVARSPEITTGQVVQPSHARLVKLTSTDLQAATNYYNPAAAAAAAAMNPMMTTGLLSNFAMPAAMAAAASPTGLGGLMQTPGTALTATPSTDARLPHQLSLTPMNSGNLLVNYSSSAGSNQMAALAAAAAAGGSQLSPSTLALLMSAYGQGAAAVTLGTAVNGNPYLGLQASAHPGLANLSGSSLLTLSPSTPNTLPLTGYTPSHTTMMGNGLAQRNLGTDVTNATDLNAFSTAMAYQRLLGYPLVQSPLLSNPTGATVNGNFNNCTTLTFGYNATLANHLN